MKHYVIVVLLFLFISPFAVAQGILENTQVRFFGNTGYSFEKDSSLLLTHNFDMSNIEMLLTSQVTDRISVLAEPVFMPNGLTIERFMISYFATESFKVSAGKLYSPIGLWNTKFYHHVKALTPTINQPVIIAEQNENGVLDNNDTGVQFSGEAISRLHLGYKLLVGNGYATNKYSDKSVTANVSIEPFSNLQIGVSGRTDHLAPGTITPRGDVLAEYNRINLLNASLMYFEGGKFEFASEYYLIQVSSSTTAVRNLHAGFAYAGYKIKRFTPYAMYNRINYDSNILWFLNNNFTGTTLGVRYNFSALSVLKLEAQFLESDAFRKLNRIGVQWAIGF